MRRTSEINISEVPVETVKRNYAYEDRHMTFVEPGFTEYVSHTSTRYHECFRYFNSDTIIGNSLKHYGEYTENEVQLLHSFCNPETITYDIGANIGYHSVGLASKCKRVYAFEPNNKNCKLLRQNAYHSNNITVINAACSNINGTGYIQDFSLDGQGNHGELSLSKEGQECNLIKLDDFVKENRLPDPHIVKIDVEGHEWEVICGMKYIIEHTLPVIMYEHLHGEHLQDVSDYLDSLGYKQFWFPVNNYNPANYKRNPTNIFGNGAVLNVVAVPFHIELHSYLPDKVKGESWPQRIERYQKENAQ